MSQHDVLTRFSRDMGGSMEPDENGSCARMKHSDVEELARKANLAQMNNAPEGVFIVDAQALSLFAALVLEKAITKLRKDLFEASNAPTQPAAGADVLDELKPLNGLSKSAALEWLENLKTSQ